MTRGTSPTIRCIIDDFEGVDISGYSFYVTLEQCGIEQTFTGDDLEIEDNIITVHLSQKNTLLLRAHKKAKLQVRGCDMDGEAFASQIVIIPDIGEILRDGEIE